MSLFFTKFILSTICSGSPADILSDSDVTSATKRCKSNYHNIIAKNSFKDDDAATTTQLATLKIPPEACLSYNVTPNNQ
jgi:hypothetical protein